MKRTWRASSGLGRVPRLLTRRPAGAGSAGGTGVIDVLPPFQRGDRRSMAAYLGRLEEAMARLERKYRPGIALVHPDHHADAVNLTHYLALRQADVRSLQRNLGARGLSSMARCEAHVLATVETVRAELDASTARPVPPELGFEAGRAALDRNTDALFGPPPQGRVPRIMVTLPSEAASDYALVRRFVSSGMDVARINGAHDDPRRLGADGAQRAQGLRRARPVVPDLRGPSGSEAAHGPPGRRDPAWCGCGPSVTSEAWPSLLPWRCSPAGRGLTARRHRRCPSRLRGSNAGSSATPSISSTPAARGGAFGWSRAKGTN